MGNEGNTVRALTTNVRVSSKDGKQFRTKVLNIARCIGDDADTHRVNCWQPNAEASARAIRSQAPEKHKSTGKVQRLGSEQQRNTSQQRAATWPCQVDDIVRTTGKPVEDRRNADPFTLCKVTILYAPSMAALTWAAKIPMARTRVTSC